MKSKWLVWALIGGALAVGVFLGLRPASAAKGVVTVDAAKTQRLLGDSSIHVVDVRTPGEYAAGHLTGAENVPVDVLASTAASWDRNTPLLVYCATGARSAQAVQELQSLGFKTIYHFSQGLQAWQGQLDTGAGQPVAQAQSIKTNGKPVMYEFFTGW